MRFVCSMKWLYENIQYSVISLLFFSVNSLLHERGHHNSYEEPPDYPILSNTAKKRTKSASELTQALTDVASVFLKSSRSDVSSHV